MTFEETLKSLKNGKKVFRAEWNGAGQFVVMQKGYPEGTPANKQTAEAFGIDEGDLFKVEPYLQLKNAQGSHVMWVPSIGDLFATDWYERSDCETCNIG